MAFTLYQFQFPLMLSSYISVVHGEINSGMCLLTNDRRYSDFTSFFILPFSFLEFNQGNKTFSCHDSLAISGFLSFVVSPGFPWC